MVAVLRSSDLLLKVEQIRPHLADCRPHRRPVLWVLPYDALHQHFEAGQRQGRLPVGATGKILAMKRRTLKQLRAKLASEQHHNVYVVLLNPAVGKLRKVRAVNPKRDSKKPSVYVGMTGLNPKERFANHKAGIKAASVVKRYGIRLLPELYEHLNPMPYEAAVQMEMDLAEDLRRTGYTITGGH